MHDSALGELSRLRLRGQSVFVRHVFLNNVGEHPCEIPLTGEMSRKRQKGCRPATGSRGRSIKL